MDSISTSYSAEEVGAKSAEATMDAISVNASSLTQRPPAA
jgi:hypothetical protein